MLFEQE